MFERVLIANRGEIACRIIRTLDRLGIASIAVHSDADRAARHVRMADRSFRIGPAPAAESYLRIDAILDAAVAAGAEAIHPGYGFLAENAAFARACTAAGIVFIGPPAAVIELMGAKDRAKAAMAAAGVPILPGHAGDDQASASLATAAAAIGYPVLIKAAAGGGGKGMRRVDRASDFPAALEGAKREALAAFGDDRVLLERLLERPRHVEVQVFGDQHGQVIHLFERDCSLQRRHQKVIEEAPAPGLSDDQRQAIGATAADAARAIGYVGAGTVEFLMEADGAFHFMEMNTRLQVEHPVTERITGLDLVDWQLQVAAGLPLPLRQSEVRIRGAAIEARLYAEAPARGFLPSSGFLQHLHIPEVGPWAEAHLGVRAGDEVTPYYDPMLAKLVVEGADRAQALARLRRWLAAIEIVGPATNLDFLHRLTGHADVIAGPVDTGFVERTLDQLLPAAAPDARALAAAVALLLAERERAAKARAGTSRDPHSPWHRVDGWRLNGTAHQTVRLRLADRVLEIDAKVEGAGHRITIDGADLRVDTRLAGDHGGLVEIDGELLPARLVVIGQTLHLTGAGGLGHVQLELDDPLLAVAEDDAAGGLLMAPMPGRIVSRLAAPGDAVRRGDPLLIMEAMKMEHTVRAPIDGRVVAVHVSEGEQVEEGVVLLDVEAADE